MALLNEQEERRAESLLRYTEDENLRRRELSDIRAFKMGLKETQPNLNCLTNPFLFDQVSRLLGFHFSLNLFFSHSLVQT